MAINPADYGMPDATTAGVQSGITLKPYTGPMTITKDGAIIENVIINGTLTIDADNVTIRNCVIQNFSNWGVLQNDGASNVRVEYCDIDGSGSTRTSGLGIGGGNNAAIIGCDIRGMVVGIQLFGAATVKDNYIHDLAERSSNPDDRHFDGITLFGGGGNVIEHNTILMPAKNGGTAAVFIKTEFGSIDNVTVKNNLMTGDPSYTVYVEDTAKGNISNVLIENNYVERGMYGYFYIVGNNPTVRNNVQWQDGVNAAPSAISAPSSSSGNGGVQPANPFVPSAPSEPSKSAAPTLPSKPTLPIDSQGSSKDGSSFWVSSDSHSSGKDAGSSSWFNQFKGTNGNDTLTGTKGADALWGLRGNDTYIVNHPGDKIFAGNQGRDTIKSSVSFDLSGTQVKGFVEKLMLTGSASISGTGDRYSNTIVGNSGDNKIAGFGGNDVLTGGGGKDTFVFNTLLNARTNVDKITDFRVGEDTIALDNAIFKALGSDGPLAASAFHTGTSAHDFNDRVIYNSNTGSLSYDRDGNASGESIQFATLSPNLNLTHLDFLVI